MSYVARVVLPLAITLLNVDCSGAGPSPPPDEAVASNAQQGYVDAGGGVRLFYRMVGSGGDTMVVLHGGPGFTMD